MRLSEISIRAVKAPSKGAAISYDDVVSGFGVRVRQAGTKSFILTHGPLRERETIGRVGIVGLSDARTEAKRRLAEYTLGKHRPRAVAWNFALQEYLSEVRATRRENTSSEYQRHLKKHFRFGDMRLMEIGPHELQKNIDKLTGAEKFHHYTTIRAFLRWAHRRHYFETNPMERMTAPPGPKPRERILTEAELRRVWIVAGDGTFGPKLKLLILTGQRVGEISKLTRDMIAWTRPPCPPGLHRMDGSTHFPSVGSQDRSSQTPSPRTCPRPRGCSFPPGERRPLSMAFQTPKQISMRETAFEIAPFMNCAGRSLRALRHKGFSFQSSNACLITSQAHSPVSSASTNATISFPRCARPWRNGRNIFESLPRRIALRRDQVLFLEADAFD
jgi:hypothetical protein